MDASLIQQGNRGTMDEEEDEMESFSSFGDEDDDESTTGSSSTTSDLMEDATSSNSSSSSSEGPLYEMASLIAQLPFKRGLSKHFHGKSQSFTSLANVMSLEDLAKPEKRLKSCKSYAAGLDGHKLSPKGSFMKKAAASRGSFSSLGVMRRPGGRPPVATQRSATQTLLFAST